MDSFMGEIPKIFTGDPRRAAGSCGWQLMLHEYVNISPCACQQPSNLTNNHVRTTGESLQFTYL